MLKIWLSDEKAWNSEDRERVQMDEQNQLSRRERQIMSIIYAQGEASAVEVWQALPDRPSRTAVRTLLRILEEKGRLRHRKGGRQFVYRPTKPRGRAGRSALQGVLTTFFDGSLEKAVAAHLSDPTARPSPEELERLARLIREARNQEKEAE
jgi:BlaI family penicillinase repressor